MSRHPWRQVRHQYIERHSGAVRNERLYGDGIVAFLYGGFSEHAPTLYAWATSARASRWLAYLNYDSWLGARAAGTRSFLESCGADLAECVESAERLDTARKLFERQIRYWACRPMPDDPRCVVSPADARALVGSLCDVSALYLKRKFFDLEELLGHDREPWRRAFDGGDFAVLRLTPDKYHYNHVPVDGRVLDLYEIPGGYHSCNPGAVVSVVTPHSKNRRVVTILDTDLPGGSAVGLVAMIEVAALMVGDICQRYSADRYAAPQPVRPGMLLKKGAPKSLFRPGGSTVVLLFQRGRVAFAEDLVANMRRADVESRLSLGFGQPVVETDVAVRSELARAAGRG
jgi:phosphatidylserine decarboxylase